MKRLALLLAAVLCLMSYAPALAADKQRTMITSDLGGPMDRVKLRDKPSLKGEVIGQYFEEVYADVLHEEGDWMYVRIGTREGYMMRKFLTGVTEVQYGAEGIPGLARFPDEDGTLALYENPDKDGKVLARLGPETVQVLGTIGKNWLHVRYTNEAETVLSGYLASSAVTHVENMAMLIVDTGKADKKASLRTAPEKSAKTVGQYYSGTTVYRLFDDSPNDDPYERVRVGDAYGFMLLSSLDESSGGAPRFTPPSGTVSKKDTSFYLSSTAKEKAGSLQKGDTALVLGIRGDRLHIWIEAEQTYAYVNKKDMKVKH